jgi:hypothetical protein
VAAKLETEQQKPAGTTETKTAENQPTAKQKKRLLQPQTSSEDIFLVIEYIYILRITLIFQDRIVWIYGLQVKMIHNG